jgi:choice-of-anchor B domain-containing protein
MMPFAVLQAQTTPDGQSEAMRGFARAVSVADGSVFIGEPSNDHQPGVVYIFEKSGDNWTQQHQLMATNGTIGDGFGSSVAANGNWLLVGAPEVNDGSGAAYLFQKSGSGNWSQVSEFMAPNDTVESALGSSVMLSGNYAFVGAPDHADGLGAVLVYSRSNSEWSEMAAIVNPDTAGSNFGSSLAMDGMNLVVGAPQRGGGAVHVFANEGSDWMHTASLSSDQAEERSQFGNSIGIHGDKVLVGAPRNDRAAGTVFVFSNEDGEWMESGRLSAFDGQSPYLFGSSITVAGSEVWVGAPNAGGGKGTIYQFMMDEDGMWSGSSKMPMSSQEEGDYFSGTLAVDGDVAVAGMTGADYGEGSAAVLERNDMGSWSTQSVVFGEGGNVLKPITNGRLDCNDGKADRFGCSNVDLISFMPIGSIGGDRGVRLNDLWGWTDPVTGKEYALVGRNEGTSFVDLTDPGNPIYVANLQKTEGSRANVWRDIKVYKNHAYIVADGAGEHGMQVLDLTQLRKFDGEPMELEATAMYENIHSAHNVVINEESGFAFIVGSSGGGQTCGGGLHMVNLQDPANPTFAGCFADPSTGRSGTGYSHDAQCVIYDGPDEEHQGSEICFGANETAISIADVTDKENPVALSTGSYPDYGYVHQGWLTEDHRYFFQNDELDELMGKVDQTRTIVWDVTDLDDPQFVREYLLENASSDHNLYIKDDLMYQSNYVSGLQVIDVSDPANPTKVGSFDTHPFTEDAPGFSGTWSNYPYFKSGIVVMTSGREGLFVLETNEQAINQ